MIKPLPQSWSALTWRQLCQAWEAKQRYGKNADVAAAAALLSLCRLTVVGRADRDHLTGEDCYLLLCATDGQHYTVTARELAHIARHTMQWLEYPYGDPGEPAKKDDKGKVIQEAREPYRGYVNPVGEWRDAMMLSEETITVEGHLFALPQVAMNNLTWHQYRAVQALVPQLMQEDVAEENVIELQAQFIAYMLVPEQEDTDEGKSSADPFRPRHRFTYDADRAEASLPFWQRYLLRPDAQPLFPICFQVYQTAIAFYSQVFHELFSGSGKSDPLHTALTGEAGTLNAVMKYAHYGSQQQVYDSPLPFVLDILNTMTKESRKIEEMNAKARRRK